MPEYTNMEPKSSKTGSGSIKKEIQSLNTKDLKASLAMGKLGSASRLPSFKGPRDLTLSALTSTSTIQPQIARPKKTFVPNIPVRREKGESKIIESKSEKYAKKGSNKSRHGEHSRGRGRGREFIQTRGALFGEGIAAAPLKRGSSSYSGHDGRGGGGSKIGEMQKPVLNTEVAYNIDKDLEDQRLKELLRDDFIDDPDDAAALDSLPIQLPMIARADPLKSAEIDSTAKIKDKWKQRESGDASEVTADQMGNLESPQIGVKIKEEPDGEKLKMADDARVNGLIRSDSALRPTQDFFEESVASLFTKSHSDIMFFQLPSCLPGHPPEVKLEPNPGASSSQTPINKEPNLGTSSQPQRNPVCTLDTLPEGQIGTIKVYESGKVEMCFGGYNLDLNRGTPVGFLQDVVRVEVDAEQKIGSMVVLGHIKDRLVCTPDFEYLSSTDLSAS